MSNPFQKSMETFIFSKLYYIHYSKAYSDEHLFNKNYFFVAYDSCYGFSYHWGEWESK